MIMLEELKVRMANLVKSIKGDVIVSDIYDYEYDVNNQKEVKQVIRMMRVLKCI